MKLLREEGETAYRDNTGSDDLNFGNRGMLFLFSLLLLFSYDSSNGCVELFFERELGSWASL